MLYVKPHIKLRIVAIMTNELTEKEPGGVPGWMRKASTGASIGNIDSSDLKPPQLKMLAGMSPEVINGQQGASPGNFWITILQQNLGKEVTGHMVLLRKSYQVWAPRGTSDQKGPLATSSNGVTWDAPNQTFEVRLPSGLVTWRIGKLVTDFGATKWGSSDPADPKSSKPLATLTYTMLWLIDLPDGRKQLCALIAARTMAEPTKKLISMMKSAGVDHYFQKFRLVSQKLAGPTGDPYFVWEYQQAGVAQSEEEGRFLMDLYQQYSKSGFITDLETEADEVPARADQQSQREDVDDIPF